MHLHPTISALIRHKVIVFLITVQIALSCAVIAIALSTIVGHLDHMRVVTGVEEEGLGWVQSSGIPQPTFAAPNPEADLHALLGDARISKASVVNALPLSGNLWSTDLYRNPGAQASAVHDVGIYEGTKGFLQVLGVKLVAGRSFKADEYTDYSPFDDKSPPPSVIITQALAKKMWPGQNPLDKPIYLGDNGKYMTRVIGVVSSMLKASLDNGTGDGYNILLPVTKVPGGMYIYRTDPVQLQSVSAQVPKILNSINPVRIITGNGYYSEVVNKYFQADWSLVHAMIVVIICLLATALLGILALSNYWTDYRRRQIGIRRALGATRLGILRMFLFENGVISGFGVVLGLVLAVVISASLMAHYELPRIDPMWGGVAAVLVWASSMLAAATPAYFASRIDPASAIRGE